MDDRDFAGVPLPADWLETVNAAMARHSGAPQNLLQVLIDVQAGLSWLPPAALTAIARGLKLSRAHVKGVAGFYSLLYTRPVGQYRVLFADNIIERMMGAPGLMADLCRKLWLEPGKTSEDGLVSVDTTSCIGMSDQGPAALINGRIVTRLTHQRIAAIGELIRTRTPVADWPADYFEVRENIRRADVLLESTLAPGDGLAEAMKRTPEAMLDEIKRAGLRGRGGAGFTTAQKWDFCRQAPIPAGGSRIVVCNADEGEPGTFKDRLLLSRYAHLVFEGMTIAAYVLGAGQGFLYLRGEYAYLRPHLEEVLRFRRAAGLLGRGICGRPGFDYDIAIHSGAGAYVCGEETALIESLEGKRGTPRIRPPFPVTHGYLGQPTAVNNVETLAAAALIAANGGAWYAGIGTPQSAGTKLLSVSGDCARPGIYEYPFGVTIADILEDCGASDAQAVQVGGAAGVTLAPDEFARRIAFEDVPTAGALMIFDSSRDMFEVARNFVHFFVHESCGFCTPCRVGTSLLKGYLDKLEAGHGSKPDLAEIETLNRVLKSASHCGLGQAAANPVLDGLRKFRPAYDRRMRHQDFEPAFDLDAALSRARQLTGRDDTAAHFAEEKA